MRRLLFAFLVFALATAACSLPLTEAQQRANDTTSTTEPGEGPTPPTSRSPQPTPTLPPLDPEDAEVLAQLPGQLAIGAGSIVALVNPDGSAGRIVGGGDGVIATQPTWSTEGTLLAWSEVTPNASAITVFDPASEGMLSSPIEGPPAFYLQWNTSEQLVAYLRNNPAGEGIEAGVVRPGGEQEVYDGGAPHFFEWAPERDFWVSHVDDSQLALVSVEEIVEVQNPTRSFSTPQWIDGDRFVYAGPNGIEVFDLNGTNPQSFPVAPGPLTFTVNPSGTHVAYLVPNGEDDGAADDGAADDGAVDDGTDEEGAELEDNGDAQPEADPDVDGTSVDAGALVTLELATGQTTTVTTEPVVMWEWSPDGSRLVWTGLDRADAANLAQLHVWSIESASEISVTPSFRPSQAMISSYFPFFTQYSVSHTSWAPDNTAFAFAGSILDESGIWVHALPTDERPGVDAARIAVGDVAFWSPNDAQAGAAAPSPF